MFELQDRLAVPEPTTVLGVIALHARPAGTSSVRATVPVKPFIGVIVSVDTAVLPLFTDAGLVVVRVKLGVEFGL